MTQFESRNITMMMDLYEMTMAYGYFKENDTEKKVAFDVFYRKNPDGGGFSIFAGLEQVIEYLENMHFEDADVEYFRSLNLFDEDFLISTLPDLKQEVHTYVFLAPPSAVLILTDFTLDFHILLDLLCE